MSNMGPALETHLSKLGGRERMIVQEYGQEVCAMRAKIDPDNEFDWCALWIGFALGKGLGHAQATDYGFYSDYVFPMESMELEDLLGPISDDYRAYLESPVLDPRD